MIEIYGASDDLVEVEGDIREEFSWTNAANDDDEDQGRLLALSNGVVLRIRYSYGVWRIMPIVGLGQVTVTQAPEGDDSNYSDRATVIGDIKWVVFGIEIARAVASNEVKNVP